MFGAIAGGIASALAGGAMSKLFGGGQKAASGGIQGDVLATDNNTVGMGDANLSTECLIQLTKLGYDATPFNQILKQNAKREMRLRLGKVTVADVLAAQPVTTNLLKFMRA